MRLGDVQQIEGADNVGGDELRRAVDGAVDVALGREVDDRARPMLPEQPRDEFPVADVAADEDVPQVFAQWCEIAEIAGVREEVEVDERLVARGEPVEHEIGADEPGPARYEDHGESGVGMVGDRPTRRALCKAAPGPPVTTITETPAAIGPSNRHRSNGRFYSPAGRP